MGENKNDEIAIDLKELFCVLLRKKWWIILSALVFSVTVFIISKYVVDPEYDSTTKIYVMNKQDNGALLTYADIEIGTKLMKDYMTLVTSRPVTEDVIDNLGLPLSHQDLLQMIQVNNPQDTRILEIRVRYNNPVMAKKIADAVREASAKHIAKVMDIEEVNIVEYANIPAGPSNHNIQKNIMIGAITGALLAAACFILLFLLNDSLKTAEDVERYLDISVLSSIPIQESELDGRKRRNERFGVIRSKKKQSRKDWIQAENLRIKKQKIAVKETNRKEKLLKQKLLKQKVARLKLGKEKDEQIKTKKEKMTKKEIMTKKAIEKKSLKHKSSKKVNVKKNNLKNRVKSDIKKNPTREKENVVIEGMQHEEEITAKEEVAAGVICSEEESKRKISEKMNQ